MTINKFQGKTKEEAIEKARLEFGPSAVIMNVKEVKPKGFLSVFKSSTYEVTAAVEEKANISNPMSALMPQAKMSNINLSADEKIDIPRPERTPDRESVPFSQTMLEMSQRAVEQPVVEDKKFKERLDNLSDMLEQRLSAQEVEEPVRKAASAEELNFVRILYSTLVKNEVHEKYVNPGLESKTHLPRCPKYFLF